MKEKIIGVISIIFGLFLIVYGNFEILNQEKASPIVKEDPPLETKNNYQEIISYLENKYHKNFEIIKTEKAYCLEVGKYNLFYSTNCDDMSVTNRIYKAKSINDDIEFYIKEVNYDQNKIIIPASEKSNESEGFYDNYISYIIAEKLEKELLPKYKEILGEDISLNIYEGFGLSDLTLDNALQYLDNSIQGISDTNIEINDFIDMSSDVSVKISIKKKDHITSDNFKDEVDLLLEATEIKIAGIFIDKILIEYENDDRYIEYDNDLKILELKKGINKYSTLNNSTSIFDRKICLNNEKILDCLTYNEFKNIDNNNFNFYLKT